MSFRNRQEAAWKLAKKLAPYRGQRPLILAVPRGGVPMGSILAQALEGDLDVILVRKLRAPGNPELAVGSVDESGRVHLNRHAGECSERYLHSEREAQLQLIQERRAQYTPVRPPIDPKDRIVITVDDGVATGATFTAALQAIRQKQPKKLIAAVGVAPRDACQELSKLADEVACVLTPEDFHGVGQFYRDFSQTEDAEIMKILAESASPHALKVSP